MKWPVCHSAWGACRLATMIPAQLQILAGIRAGPWKTADPFATVAVSILGIFPYLQSDVQHSGLTCPSFRKLLRPSSWQEGNF